MDFYLQLEQHKLVFKLYVYQKAERNEARSIYRKYLFKKAEEMGIKISKFGRLGKWMGVAKLDSDYRVDNIDGTLNVELTVQNLVRITKLLEDVQSEIKG